MTKTRVLSIVIVFVLSAIGVMAEAQSTRIYRIGYLDDGALPGAAPFLEVFKERLRELGWVEGKNIAFEYRFRDEGKIDRLNELATDLVRLNVDIIVTRATEGALAAKRATSTTPIVMVSGGDPVGAGIVKSLARPGGNITGISTLSPELNTKRLETLKDVVPKLKVVGILSGGDGTSVGVKRQLKELEPAAQALKLKLIYILGKREANAWDTVFEKAKQNRVDGVTPIGGSGRYVYAKRIVELAAKHRLPAIYASREFVDAGGLMSYGIDYPDQYRRGAYFVDRILKGAKPADLPVELPTKYEFVINLVAAKQIGLTISPLVLAIADKVIR